MERQDRATFVVCRRYSIFKVVYVMHFGASMFVPMIKAEEENLIVKNMRDREANILELDGQGRHKVKVYPNGDQDSYLMSDISEEGRIEK